MMLVTINLTYQMRLDTYVYKYETTYVCLFEDAMKAYFW